MQILKQVHIAQVGGERGWSVTVLKETTQTATVSKVESDHKTVDIPTWRGVMAYLGGLQP